MIRKTSVDRCLSGGDFRQVSGYGKLVVEAGSALPKPVSFGQDRESMP